MAHTKVKLIVQKQELKKALTEGRKPDHVKENTGQRCEIPADEIMLNILHRLINKGDTNGDTGKDEDAGTAADSGGVCPV